MPRARPLSPALLLAFLLLLGAAGPVRAASETESRHAVWRDCLSRNFGIQAALTERDLAADAAFRACRSAEEAYLTALDRLAAPRRRRRRPGPAAARRARPGLAGRRPRLSRLALSEVLPRAKCCPERSPASSVGFRLMASAPPSLRAKRSNPEQRIVCEGRVTLDHFASRVMTAETRQPKRSNGNLIRRRRRSSFERSRSAPPVCRGSASTFRRPASA